MNNKTKMAFGIFTSLTLLMILEVFYLESTQTMTEQAKEDKRSFTTLVGLPDLAIAQESSMRHRSLSSVFSLYSADGALREYDRVSFTLSNTKEYK